MSWLDDIRSGDAWTDSPWATTGKAIACALAGPLCVAADVGETSATIAQEASEAIGDGDGLIDDIGENVTNAINAASDAAKNAAEIAKWISIGIYGLTALAIVIFIVAIF